jgi:hypothetical protein
LFNYISVSRALRRSYTSLYNKNWVHWVGVELGHFAARILKKPNIEKYGLYELAREVGVDIKESIGECPDWNAKVFSHEEIKYEMQNAYKVLL